MEEREDIGSSHNRCPGFGGLCGVGTERGQPSYGAERLGQVALDLVADSHHHVHFGRQLLFSVDDLAERGV